MTDPLIVSAVLAANVQDDLDARRRRYFPADRLHVGAHLTLFHALPGDRQGEVAAALGRLTPGRNDETLAGVRAGHEPYGTVVEALALWRYRGGPWEAAGEFAFEGSGRTARPGA